MQNYARKLKGQNVALNWVTVYRKYLQLPRVVSFFNYLVVYFPRISGSFKCLCYVVTLVNSWLALSRNPDAMKKLLENHSVDKVKKL